MSYYNVKSTEQDGTYLFTKFDDDLNIVDDSVYLTSSTDCTCPAGVRPSCRHRQMLPSFLATSRIDTDWFFCHETGDWSQPFGEALDDSVEITAEDIAEAQQAPDSPPTEADWMAMTVANVKPRSAHSILCRRTREPIAVLLDGGVCKCASDDLCVMITATVPEAEHPALSKADGHDPFEGSVVIPHSLRRTLRRL